MCYPVPKPPDKELPHIAVRWKSLTPLPGLLARLCKRRRATCDLPVSVTSTAFGWSGCRSNKVGRNTVYRAPLLPSIPNFHRIGLTAGRLRVFCPERFRSGVNISGYAGGMQGSPITPSQFARILYRPATAPITRARSESHVHPSIRRRLESPCFRQLSIQEHKGMAKRLSAR